MTSKFVKEILSTINKFRKDPSTIKKQCESIRKAISKENSSDPFLKEIDRFIKDLDDLSQMNVLSLNSQLCSVAEKELDKYINDENYEAYRTEKEMEGVVSEEWLEQNPGLVADDGAEKPEEVCPKLLLNKSDKNKVGRKLLTDSNYSQIGIAHQFVEDTNVYLVILANKDPEDDEEEPKVPEGDLTELKQAFDLFDRGHSGEIKIEEAIQAMKSMQFDETNPILFSIMNELADKGTVSWPKFSSHVVKRLTNRKDKEGLKRIFDLFIDNEKHQTINYESFKKICKEIGEIMTEAQMKHILLNTTENGNEISFNDFCQYMQVEN